MKNFENTASGAKKALATLMGESMKFVAGATCQPDPHVEGVWLVKVPGKGSAIVYLAGYKEPWGNVRQEDDFEADFD